MYHAVRIMSRLFALEVVEGARSMRSLVVSTVLFTCLFQINSVLKEKEMIANFFSFSSRSIETLDFATLCYPTSGP